ncbi:MAG: hypothetical protein HUU41_08050 [Bryobacteraceae bacterium]|nr:hypothetical protein [Bryobacterales bacterium]MEB2360766.1 hypothetical protein [Bryobacterales bacterium]NUN01051.1 hypothetical protein [Bryobacteraceae bacterium]
MRDIRKLTTLKRLALLLLLAAAPSSAGTVRFKERCLEDLVAQVPKILASQDAKTGRFGEGIWIVTDQNVLLPLAAAWSFQHERNPYYHKPEVLNAIMAGGDALIDDQDADGRWVFRKKDASTWGKIYMPWTYSRWIRAFELVRGAMPEARRTRWDRALRLGYEGIAKELAGGRIHNIPAHHAMGLYFAGRVFGRPEWKQQASEFLHRVAAAQRAPGYWSENKGPVVLYGTVYVEALGTYFAASRDAAILPVLSKSGLFHSYFTYPDGSDVETIDERNYYHPEVRLPNVGFTVTPEGRRFTNRRLRAFKGTLPADQAASLLLWGEEGEEGGGGAPEGDFDFVLGDGEAAVRRRGPWYLVVSAITAPVPASRWIQDRQNFISVYHDAAGLILGGGNTKLQPAWSAFTIGDIGKWLRPPGEEEPDFRPPYGLVHVPTSAKLLTGDLFGVELGYAGRKGQITLDVKGPERLDYAVSGEPSMTAHIVALRGFGDSRPSRPEVRLQPPAGSILRYPMLPYDPYRKDGKAGAEHGRLVIEFPADGKHTMVVEVRH